MTIRQLATALSCDNALLSRIERGKARPSIALARKIFQYFSGELHLAEIHDPFYGQEEDNAGT